MCLGVGGLINFISGVFIMQVQGIYDSSANILTISGDSLKAFKVKGAIIDLDMDARLKSLTDWARKNAFIGKHSVIAEI